MTRLARLLLCLASLCSILGQVKCVVVDRSVANWDGSVLNGCMCMCNMAQIARARAC